MARLYTGLVAGVRTHWLDSGPAPAGVSDVVAMPFCGQRGKRPMLDLSWIGYAAGALATLQQGCALARADATTCATVQMGTNTVSPAVAANQALIGRALDADPLALVHEPTRTNVLQDSTPTNARQWALSNGYGATWVGGSPAGPNGAAASVQGWASTGIGRFADLGVAGSGVVFSWSGWLQRGGADNNNISVYRNNALTWASASVLDTAATSAWQRFVISFTGTNGAGGAADRVGFGAEGKTPYNLTSTQNVNAALWQCEAGKWSSETIVTAGAAATRAGSHLSAAAPAALVSGGRVSLYVQAQIKHTPANADAAMRLWTQDANNYVEIATTGVVTVAVGGATNTTAAAAWAADDAVEFRVAFGGGIATVVKYAINGGAYATLAITGSALGTVTIAPGASIDLLSNGTTNQPGVRLRALQVVPQAVSAGW